MFKQLRTKFILLNMVTVTAVLAIVFTTVCVLNYRVTLNEVKTQLASSAQAGYESLRFSLMGPGGWYDNIDASTDDNDTRPQIGGHGRTSADFPVAVYAMITDESGNTIFYTLREVSNATVSNETLEELAGMLTSEDDCFSTFSKLELYAYQKDYNGVTIVALADTSATDGWKPLALILGLVGLGTLLVFFVISLFFSRWALRPVQEAWDKERRFVADVSHDLKTPLTVILANTAIMQENRDASVAEMSQWVESTQAEALEMQGLVTDMLELSKLDAAEEAKAEPVFETVDLSGVAEGQALMFESVAFERQVSLESDVEEGIVVQGQTSQLNRLCGILLDNACKYTPQGGAITLCLKKDAAAKHAILSVTNTGEPISPEDLEHLFDRFYRADAARTQGGEVGGHGLGLAIAHAIVTAHKGTLTATSTAEEGTCFTVTLPVG